MWKFIFKIKQFFCSHNKIQQVAGGSIEEYCSKCKKSFVKTPRLFSIGDKVKLKSKVLGTNNPSEELKFGNTYTINYIFNVTKFKLIQIVGVKEIPNFRYLSDIFEKC